MNTNPRLSRSARWLAGALCVASLTACAPLMVGGALTGAMVAVDRRSSGAQLDDEGIELRASNRLRDEMGNRARVSVTSYNHRVLLTGEAANQAAKATAQPSSTGVKGKASGPSGKVCMAGLGYSARPWPASSKVRPSRI